MSHSTALRARVGVAIATHAAIVAVAVFAIVGPTSSATGATSPAASSWTMYGQNDARTSVQPSSPSLLPLRVRWKRPNLNGAIYGQPLIANGRIYVATEADVVYALNASNGRIIWQRSVGTPVSASSLPCGDISPTVGITSTMVLDPTQDRLFASAAVQAGGQVRHMLIGIVASTGSLAFRSDLDQPGWSAPAQLQRGALGLDQGRVLIGFGGNYGDCGRYHGWVMSVSESGGKPIAFQVPTQNEGAIWGAAGMAITASGDIYVSTGNGSSSKAFDEGDSVIELSPQLHQIGYWAPRNWAADNQSDSDLGSNAPMLLPGNRVFIVGKEDTAYVLRAAALGGIGGELSSVNACFSLGASAYIAGRVFVACPNEGVIGFRLSGSRLEQIWQAVNGVGGSPTIAGGLVFVVTSGSLFALNPSNGAIVAKISCTFTEHFAAASSAQGLVLVAGDGEVDAFEGPSGYLS